MTHVLTTLRNSFSPLQFPNFRTYLSGQSISLIGTWLQVTAQGWLIWTLTGSEAASGLVAMLNALPLLLFGAYAGVWAERLDRRKLLIVTQICAMLLAFVLAFLVQSQLVEIWHVFVLSFLLGTVNAFDLPTQQTFLGDLSGMGEVRKAVNLNAMMLQVSRVIGPALAGIIVARVGIAPAFWLNGISFLAVVATLVAVRSNQVMRPNLAPVQPLKALSEALRYLGTQPRLQDLFIVAILVVFLFFSIIFSQLPAVASKLLNGDASTLGTIQAFAGAGSLIAVILIMPLAQSLKRIGIVFASALVWMGVWWLVFSASRSVALSSIAIFFGSMGAPTVLATALGLLQVMVPIDMRSRIISLFTMISFGLQTFTVLIIGFVAENLGVGTAIEINGVLLIVGAVALLLFRPEFRNWEMTAQPIPPPVSVAVVSGD